MNALPEPKQVLSIEQFLSSLDQKNSQIDLMCATLETSRHIMMIYKKDSSLYEMVKGRISPFRLPVVDKPLQVVFEMRDAHEIILRAFYAYHMAGAGLDPEEYDERIWGDLYLKRGYGYYFTGAYGNTRSLIVYPEYRPDRFDKDLLAEYRR